MTRRKTKKLGYIVQGPHGAYSFHTGSKYPSPGCLFWSRRATVFPTWSQAHAAIRSTLEYSQEIGADWKPTEYRIVVARTP